MIERVLYNVQRLQQGNGCTMCERRLLIVQGGQCKQGRFPKLTKKDVAVRLKNPRQEVSIDVELHTDVGLSPTTRHKRKGSHCENFQLPASSRASSVARPCNRSSRYHSHRLPSAAAYLQRDFGLSTQALFAFDAMFPLLSSAHTAVALCLAIACANRACWLVAVICCGTEVSNSHRDGFSFK